MNTDHFTCPVCEYPGLDNRPWTGGSSSDEICPSCGTQFGLDDANPGDESARSIQYSVLRQRWIDGGRNWWSVSRQPIDDWRPTVNERELAGPDPSWQDSPISISLSTPPDRDGLVADLFIGQQQVAEVVAAEGGFTVEFYGAAFDEAWPAPVDAVIAALNAACERLEGRCE